MADLKTPSNPLFLRDEELRQGIELMFYAYRDFTSDPDQVLKAYGFGRAHHRVIHFVGRNPGIAVAELLKILRITKQSLSRVLSTLIARGFIAQQQGARDRRQRLLYLTPAGIDLEREVSRPQKARVAKAYRDAGAEAVAAHRKVLLNLIDEKEREEILKGIMKP